MAQATWEKQAVGLEYEKIIKKKSTNWKFLVGGGLILASVLYLIISSTISGASYFITVEDLLANPEYVGQRVRISGAVLGHTIEYDSKNLILDFTISHIPDEYDNLAEALHQSVNDPTMAQIPVHIENQVKPDLLRHEAQAIVTGYLGEDGVFYASELNLKCPSRFDDGSSSQNLADDIDYSEEYSDYAG
ncbi:MAG: hypothetical protein Kow00117_07370 [Phototrophicales bacterium]